MPEVTQHAPGTPSWVDIGSPDIPGTVAFYTALFGWTTNDLGPDAGNYTMFQLRGKDVAAVGPAQNPGPPAWTTYITVADVEWSAEAIGAAGGIVVVPPMNVMHAGRMAVAADPAGGMFSIWQPLDSIGAEIVNEPNTLCWNEYATRDIDAAISFYGTVFGWGVNRSPQGGAPGDEYVEFTLDGRSIGGCLPMNENFPPDLPPHWGIYFAVDDADASAAKAAELGGTVHAPPFDIPVGRIAVIQDPQGAMFMIIKLALPPD